MVIFVYEQGLEVFTQLEWKEWEEDMAMGMTIMNTIFMRSTCTTWTGWSIRKWRCLLLSSPPLASVSLFLSMQLFSSKRRLPLLNFAQQNVLSSAIIWMTFKFLFSTLLLWVQSVCSSHIFVILFSHSLL